MNLPRLSRPHPHCFHSSHSFHSFHSFRSHLIRLALGGQTGAEAPTWTEFVGCVSQRCLTASIPIENAAAAVRTDARVHGMGLIRLVAAELEAQLGRPVPRSTALSLPVPPPFCHPFNCPFAARSLPFHCPFMARSLPFRCPFTACLHCLFTVLSLPLQVRPVFEDSSTLLVSVDGSVGALHVGLAKVH